jgi:hypothetical protein
MSLASEFARDCANKDGSMLSFVSLFNRSFFLFCVRDIQLVHALFQQVQNNNFQLTQSA